MSKTILILTWSTILIAILSGCALYIHNDEKQSYIGQQKAQMQELGQACLHHVHNMSASADANLKDLYSFGQTIDDPQYIKWQATMQCLLHYPLYSGQPSYMEFNTKL